MSRSLLGGTETKFNSAITAGTPVLAITNGNTDRILVITRIRGVAGQDLLLKQGTSSGSATQIGNTIAAQDNFDIPGTEIQLAAGNNLYIDASANDTPDITITWTSETVAKSVTR